MSPSSPQRAQAFEAPYSEDRIKRNKHGAEFKKVEASRPDYNSSETIRYTKTPNPNWKTGDGASLPSYPHMVKGSKEEYYQNKQKNKVSFDPYEQGRDLVNNYKLMISSVVPRPIALASTISADGKTRNLAPFSYFQGVCTDPPLFSLSLLGRKANDTLQNLLATKELCISLTAEWLVEAQNFASINAPPNVSEWDLSGLTPQPADIVKPPYIAESPFSIECKLHSYQEFYSKVTPGLRTSTLVVVEAVRFHAWEDVIDGEKAALHLERIKPVFRAGGQTYGRVGDVFEIPRPEAYSKLVSTGEIRGDEGSSTRPKNRDSPL